MRNLALEGDGRRQNTPCPLEVTLPLAGPSGHATKPVPAPRIVGSGRDGGRAHGTAEKHESRKGKAIEDARASGIPATQGGQCYTARVAAREGEA
jgi:hypothetical protein